MTPFFFFFFFTFTFTHDKRHVHTYIYTHIYTLIHIVIHTQVHLFSHSMALLLIRLSFFPSLLYCLYSRVALTLKFLWQRFFNALPSNLARLIRYVTRQLFFSSSLLHPLFLIFTTYFRQSRPTDLNARARATHAHYTHSLRLFVSVLFFIKETHYFLRIYAIRTNSIKVSYFKNDQTSTHTHTYT